MSRSGDVGKLLKKLNRRLQLLKEQQAVKGLNTPPEVLIEIEELESQMQSLEAELIERDETVQVLLTKLDSGVSTTQASKISHLSGNSTLEITLVHLGANRSLDQAKVGIGAEVA